MELDEVISKDNNVRFLQSMVFLWQKSNSFSSGEHPFATKSRLIVQCMMQRMIFPVVALS
jgi:hypothetical protein